MTLVLIGLLTGCSGPRQSSESGEVRNIDRSDNLLLYQNNKSFPGKIEGYYSSGKKKYEFDVEDGERSRNFKMWYPNGQLKIEGQLYLYYPESDQFLVDGMFSAYNPEGELVVRERYERGFWSPKIESFRSPGTGFIWMASSPSFASEFKGSQEERIPSALYFKMVEKVEEQKLSKWARIPSITDVAGFHEAGEELPKFAEPVRPCPPGYRLPNPGDLEKELFHSANSTVENPYFTLESLGKWDAEKRNSVEFGSAGYYWILGEAGYQVAKLTDGEIEYLTPEPNHGYPVRCLFNPVGTPEAPAFERTFSEDDPADQLKEFADDLSGKLVVYLCLNRNGRVIHREINHNRTDMECEDLHGVILSMVENYVFPSDHSAPQAQCGDFIFEFD